MELPKDREDLIAKIKAFETFMYSDRTLFEDAIVDYQESFGRPEFLYSEKLARNDDFDHVLPQFADAMGFIHGDTLSEREYLKNHSPDRVYDIQKLDDFHKLELEVIRAVANYRIAHRKDIER